MALSRKRIFSILVILLLLCGGMGWYILKYAEEGPITILDYSYQLEEEKDSLDLSYIFWACACANWLEVSKFPKTKGEEIQAEDCLFIEAVSAQNLLPDSLHNSQQTIRFYGSFYQHPGISRDYKKPTSQKPEAARVFRYDSFKIVLPQIEVLWDSSYVIREDSFQLSFLKKDKQEYLRIQKNQKDRLMLSIDGILHQLSIEDINQDHYPDLLIWQIQNSIWADLYLYDTLLGQYHHVEAFEKFPEPKLLKHGYPYFYSYATTGCADINWESVLFKVSDYHCQEFARISADCCDAAGNEQSCIRLISASNKLIRKFHTDSIAAFDDDKRGFIEHIWNTEFQQFSMD
ncbi:hypothetical protein [Croceimicrobium hydrocarbonivorans]|uniref:Uncharacterized protein n=1 Tax=Croceimicrobium hydrocarbonivorans TaxID=2761580 RepID=A0A7H0VDM9_9FLAO|nr:hypothetical protein [Croceimicrobium hydrocarbonivorans]QNR23827.1 hypothetical protein H4K34_15835 [Croceimicrobium hydrocarbonivorans]